MKALPDWDKRMADELHRHKALPYRIGVHDCCLFAGDMVQAMTGQDPMPEFRGRYHSAREAVRVLRAHGGLEAILRRKFGRPVSYRQARRGDVTLYRRNTLGICLGAHAAVPERNGGICLRPMCEMRKVFSWRPQ